MDKKLQQISIFAITILVLIIIFNAISNKNLESPSAMEIRTLAPEVEAKKVDPVPSTPQEVPNQNINVPGGVIDKNPAPNAPTVTAESKKTLNDFQQEFKIQIPEELSTYNFETLRSDEDSSLKGIVSKNSKGDGTIALLATKKNPSLEDIKKFISSSVAEDLNLQISEEDLKKIESVKAPSDSGFSSISAWTIKQGGNISIISFVKRADGQGVYLNILSGPQKSIEANEDYYEHLMDSFKAR